MTVRILVKGRVQGVFYRASTKAKARDLGIKGFVSNQSDGSVLIEAEGTEDKIQSLIDWCEQGPPAAEVESCDREEISAKNFSSFTIK